MNRKGLVKGILLVYFARSLYGGQIIENINVSSRDINFSKNGMYDVVKLKGCNLSRVPGFPVLPEKVVRILIPSEADIKGVKIMSSRVESIPGRYYIYPAQKSYPISGKKKTATIKFDSAIYKRNSNFPAEIIKYSNTGNMGGYKIASFLIYPIQYNPVQKKLILNSDIQILVSYDENISQSTESVQHPVFRRVVSSNVINPEGIKDYNAGVKSKFGAIEYVIITTDSFISSFQFLADWKTKKGVPAKIVTLDSIYINYSGRDNAEKVRNFIKYTNINWGAIWFLLGGQCDYENGHQIVPRRDVYYISASEGAYNDEDTIPSDLYFSDLDGTWNNDNDAIWGEAPEDGDTVDLYGDVFVGRVPARNKLQVQNFVNKVLTYEKNPPSGYLKRMFFPTAELFDPTHDGTISQEIISSFMPSGWQGIKLYERGGNLTRARTIDTIKSGVGFSHMVGHGNENGIYLYVGGSYLNSSNADTLKNGNKLCIINSIACFTGAMDEVVFGDCFAERLLNATQGGAVGVIMNSRYGWGNASGEIGESEAVDTAFYYELFVNNCYNLGFAHAMSKNLLVPGVFWDNDVLPWVLYELNLFGDPEMPLWTDEPKNLDVAKADTLLIGQSNLLVNITSSSVPVESVLVCAMKGTEVYARGYTDGSGQLNLILSPPPATIGDMYLTATKHNYKPYEDTLLVKAIGTVENSNIENQKLKLTVKPTPFLNSTNIHYQIPFYVNNLNIKICDVSGRCVKTIVQESKLAGNYTIKFYAKDLSAGVYFVKLDIGDYKETKKLILMK